MDNEQLNDAFKDMSNRMLCLSSQLTQIQEYIGRGFQATKDSIEEKITESSAFIQKDILFMKDVAISNLRNENKSLRSRVTTLESRLLAVERQVNRVEQNHRKNNLEFDGIPNSVSDANLTEMVVRIINAVIDVNITSRDIEACHRLHSNRRNRPKPTIIRAGRNLLDMIRSNRKRLMGIAERVNLPPGTKIFVNENLSPNMKTVDHNARRLVNDGLIESSWFSNAMVRLKCKNGNVLKVNHEADLFDNFPSYGNFSFETGLYDHVLNHDMDALVNLDESFSDMEELSFADVAARLGPGSGTGSDVEIGIGIDAGHVNGAGNGARNGAVNGAGNGSVDVEVENV